MILEIPFWTSHHNMILYASYLYCETKNINLKIDFNKSIPANGAILYYNTKIIFFDYSDDFIFIDNPKRYHVYFKRTLSVENKYDNVYTLNFQVNYSYKSLFLFFKFDFKGLISKNNKTEVIRALDYFNLGTNLSHNAMDVRSFPQKIKDNNGVVIFRTRLWNPDNHPDRDEKERRTLQNQFRINACRIIKKMNKKSSVGLYPDSLSIKMAPDLILDVNKTSKKEYFNILNAADIGIADDGLKNSPGWKIGEYLLFGKAVITTPLTTSLDNFEEHINYEKVSTRNAYEELPEKITYLIEDKKYLEMGAKNLEWSENYLCPQNYFQKIISIVDRN